MEKIKTSSWWVLFVLLLLGLVFVLFWTPTDPEGTTRLLQTQGYTNIQITGYRYWIKDDKDRYSTGFIATSPNGSIVSGAVTKGWFKGQTIRFDND